MSFPRTDRRTRRSLKRAQKVRIFDRAHGICHVCGGKIHAERGEAWEVEHVVALADGGADEPWNMAPAHVDPCHKGKTAEESTGRAKVMRLRANHLGVPKPAKVKLPCGRSSGYRKSVEGKVIARTTQVAEHARVMDELFGGMAR
jgi:5-methylcytosine-specific restriction endonuclease McrA